MCRNKLEINLRFQLHDSGDPSDLVTGYKFFSPWLHFPVSLQVPYVDSLWYNFFFHELSHLQSEIYMLLMLQIRYSSGSTTAVFTDPEREFKWQHMQVYLIFREFHYFLQYNPCRTIVLFRLPVFRSRFRSMYVIVIRAL